MIYLRKTALRDIFFEEHYGLLTIVSVDRTRDPAKIDRISLDRNETKALMEYYEKED